MKKSKRKVVLDTNVFIKGWFSEDEDCQKIMRMIDSRKFYLAFGQDTIGELIYLVKNFARKHVEKKADQLLMVKSVAELFFYASAVNTLETEFEKTNDEFDDMFLKCAIEANADYLVSDDLRSGLHDKDGYQFDVVTSKEFVELCEIGII